MEVGFKTIVECCIQIIWMKQTLKGIKIEYGQPNRIYYKNTIAISVSKNPSMHLMTKHIPIKYHFLGERVDERDGKLEYINTKEQITDIFTNPLLREYFEYLRENMGVIPYQTI